MANEMISYLQQLEILAFFSGYPLIYAIVAYLKSTATSKPTIKNSAFNLLPFEYATIGLLYVALQIKNLYPDYSIKHLSSEIQIPFFVCWALSSLVFLTPFFNKKPIVSLLHSLVFFYLIIRNFYLQLISIEPDKNVLTNLRRVYSDSLLLNATIFIVLLIIYYGARFLKQKSASLH